MPGEHLLVIDDSPTLLKVVESTLTRAGYRVDTAADGLSGLSLVREARTVPDLILLDGVIPGTDPAEICRELAGDATLGRVPVIVMATKGDDLEARFARASNVVDYISKPFSPDALEAVVSHVVESRARRAEAAPGGPVPEREGATGPTDASRAAVAEALSKSATPEATATVLGGYALTGDLAVIALGDVFSMLEERAQSGVLRVVNTATRAQIELVFDEGRIDFAGAVGVSEEFLLGRFAVERGDVTAASLDAVLAERKRAASRPPLFGADLVARKLLTEVQLKRAMVRQTSELVYETLRWTHGFFQLRRGTDGDAEAALFALARGAALAINVDRLLLEGYRRVDEWRVIERVIDSFDRVFVRDESKIADLPRGTFTREELAVLERIDGRLTVREIVRALRLGSFDVSKVLFRLLRTKLIRPRVAPTAV
ncbi:MAG TPA: response regulator [Polyangia bacterium]|nr:response regulator [Polyangia bacterium]